MAEKLKIIGGGLSGCEAAWQAAERGIHVDLYEMRPKNTTEAHQTGHLGELVCSNSLGSKSFSSGTGLLFNELKSLNSIICNIAEQCEVPAGSALAVDRHVFASRLTEAISSHPRINIIREEVTRIPAGPTLIASGPLTSAPLAKALQLFHGKENLFFFDAIAPIISANSIDMNIAFRASRYGKGTTDAGDYINCPLDKDTYLHFVEELSNATQIELKHFEREIESGVTAGKGHFFEGCLPVEVLARRGLNALSYGPLRPVGLRKQYQGKPPYAIVQLRQDSLNGSVYNMVGFQTNLTYSEQKRVFRTIPGLEHAEFIRYGQMHRNTFLFAPSLVNSHLQSIQREDLFFAGQLIGVEGYLGNAASGLVAGVNAARFVHGKQLLSFPQETMIGALCSFVTQAPQRDFQPMKANFGILSPIVPKVRDKREKKAALSERSMRILPKFMSSYDD